jgi:hypothetical protein
VVLRASCTIRALRAAAPLLATLASTGCVATVPPLAGEDAGLDTPCTPFADLVIELKPAGGDNDPAAGMPALGPPDGAAVTIATDTILTVGFTGLGAVIDAEGPDLGVAVVGTPSADTLVSAYGSVDGFDFDYLGDLTMANTTLDLRVARDQSASYVRLIGITGALAVDAIEAVQATCPAATFSGV